MVHLVPVNLAPEDLQANERGLLSKAQVRSLSQRRLLFLAGTIGFAALLAALVVMLLLKLQYPTFASRGELFLWVPVSLFWLWLLRRSPTQWYRANIDLREGGIASLEGRVLCRWENSFGMIQFPRYEIRVAGQAFPVSSSEFFQFSNQGAYQVFYAPRSKVFLGAVPAAAGQPPAADGLQAAPADGLQAAPAADGLQAISGLPFSRFAVLANLKTELAAASCGREG